MFAGIKKAIKNHYNPETVTVRIPTDWGQDYFEITYIANDDVQKHMAQYMAENGKNICKNGKHISYSENLLDIEKSLGLKRHNGKDADGKIVPAVHYVQHFFGKTDSYELWDRGNPVELFGVHHWCMTHKGIEPSNGTTGFKMEEGREKQTAIAQLGAYFFKPTVAA